MIRENAFEHKIKKTRVSFNPGLSANRPSNNSAQEILKTFTWTCPPPNKPRDLTEVKTKERKNRDLADTYLR